MRGHCPDSGVLVDFVDNILPPAEAEAVERHLAGCQLCTGEVTILRQSLNADPREGGADAERETRIRERFRRFLLRRERPGAHWAGPRPFITAALAAGVLILLYPAWLGVKQMLPRIMPADPAAHIVRLDPVTRSANAPLTVIRPDPDAQYLGLMFFAPIPGSLPAKVHCRLQRGGRDVLATQNLASFDALGNFLLLIRRDSLKAAPDYLLAVSVSADAARTWQFHFALEAPAP